MINPGQMYKMQREAKKQQAEMRKVKVSGESRDGMIRVYFNGAQELENITIDSELLNPDRQTDVVDGIKEAYKDYQKKLQKKMAQELDLDDLKRMLGGS